MPWTLFLFALLCLNIWMYCFTLNEHQSCVSLGIYRNCNFFFSHFDRYQFNGHYYHLWFHGAITVGRLISCYFNQLCIAAYPYLYFFSLAGSSGNFLWVHSMSFSHFRLLKESWLLSWGRWSSLPLLMCIAAVFVVKRVSSVRFATMEKSFIPLRTFLRAGTVIKLTFDSFNVLLDSQPHDLLLFK